MSKFEITLLSIIFVLAGISVVLTRELKTVITANTDLQSDLAKYESDAAVYSREWGNCMAKIYETEESSNAN